MHKPPREIPQHKNKSIKLMAVVHRLQRLMVNENLTPDELVGCVQIVRDNYGRLNDMIQPGTFPPTIPLRDPPRYP
ncbi:TPA: hypothetical protein ACIJT1_003370 [Citrobacter freundii]|uniref:hypothetical protein n=1 Tax=Citrobacter TaxID=544 RepID=UPI002578F02B|nr:hypothetical protein [Citrobacter sp. Cf097]MDM3202718.1 hypothetical protein [Citrobacter sp. Cf097]